MKRRSWLAAAVVVLASMFLGVVASAAPTRVVVEQDRVSTLARSLPTTGVIGKPLRSAGRVDVSQAACNTFNDPPGDNEGGLAPDITTVQVCSDAAGRLTFTVSLPSESDGIGAGEFFALFLDTDKNPATGDVGAEYVIAVDGDTNSIGLGRWTGTAYTFSTPQSTLSGFFTFPNLVVNVNTSDLGGTMGFNFDLAVSRTNPATTMRHSDFAPDLGIWSHDVERAPSPPPPATGPLTCATSRATAGDDVIVGTPRNDVICGGGGDDRINGRGGRDTIYGGVGGDTILGGFGDDRLFGQGGGDTLRGGDGGDRLVGGPGGDRLEGNSASDSINGGGGGDTILGWAGNDAITGGRDRDTMSGMAGSDRFYARDGVRDAVRGGAGTDRASVDCRRDVRTSIEGLFSPSSCTPTRT
jgi:Ca2+-binding RTX toxin-like protein